MTVEQILLVLVVAIPLALVITNQLRIDLAALSIAVLLGLAQFAGLGILDAPGRPASAAKAISGFGQPVVITLLSLFIMTRCLEKSGITRWIARYLLKMGGRSETRLIVLFASAAAFLSLFMNNLAAGALLLPSALEAARQANIRPSKLLIPVAYGSLLGGTATYFTTANIIVSDLLRIASPPQQPLNILDFTPVGGLIAIAGIIFLGLFGRRLLPDRAVSPIYTAVRPTGSELEDAYQLGERLWQGCILANSPLVGKTLAQSALGESLGVTVPAMHRQDELIFPLSPSQMMQEGDCLLIVGRADRVLPLADQGILLEKAPSDEHISTLGLKLLEVMPAPRSGVDGKTLKELHFRSKYNFTAIALWSKGRSYRTNVADFKLQLGDSLLMVGPPEQVSLLRSSPDFIVLEPSLSDQPVDRRQAATSVAVVLAAIGASIAGVPVYLATLAGAIMIILLGLLTAEEAYRSVEWQAIFLIAGMYTVSLSMGQTGLAAAIGQVMVQAITPFGSLGLAAGTFLLSSLLTQVMGGQVTALVTGPIAISAAIGLHASPQAIAVATAIGCSASFLTPVAHPVNILMIAPANYRFSDFFRIGWPLTILSFVMLLLGMALFWGL